MLSRAASAIAHRFPFDTPPRTATLISLACAWSGTTALGRRSSDMVSMRRLVSLVLGLLLAARPAAAEEKGWAFRVPARPAVPAATTRARNPIDAFLAARFQVVGLTFSPEADRRTLIRRL